MTDPFESRVKELAQDFSYPPTPQMDAKVMEKLLARSQSRRFQARRLVWGIAIVLALLAGLMAVPPVRAAVLEFIQIGIVRIFIPPTPTAEVPGTALPGTIIPLTATPASTQQALIPLLEKISGETTLEDARQQVDFAIPLPTYPVDLGQPDRVFVQDANGWMVVLVWLDAQNPGQVRMSLHLIESGSWAVQKVEPRVIEETTVNSQRALWTVGPYPLTLSNENVELTRLIDGHVLIWEKDNLTYRLETDLSMEEAIRIAESLTSP